MHLRVDILYGGMAVAYLFAILGLEKNVVFGLLAVGYCFLLPSTEVRNAEEKGRPFGRPFSSWTAVSSPAMTY
jgi:hypothetical protein